MFVNLYTPNTAYVSNLVSNDIKSFFFSPPTVSKYSYFWHLLWWRWGFFRSISVLILRQVLCVPNQSSPLLASTHLSWTHFCTSCFQMLHTSDLEPFSKVPSATEVSPAAVKRRRLSLRTPASLNHWYYLLPRLIFTLVSCSDRPHPVWDGEHFLQSIYTSNIRLVFVLPLFYWKLRQSVCWHKIFSRFIF